MRNVQKRNHTGRRYVFICGLHRSGTSLLGRNIARMENCTGFKDTGVIEDEGQFLQDVYPNGHDYGGAGRFGFDSRAHLTETSVSVDPGERAETAAELGTLLGSKQGHPRGKDPGQSSEDTFSASSVP